MYRRADDTASALAEMGLPTTLSGHFEPEAVGIFDENIPAFLLFSELATQWRMGYAGPTGLDYAVLPAVFDVYPIAPADRRAMFDDIRVMERAALNEMAKK